MHGGTGGSCFHIVVVAVAVQVAEAVAVAVAVAVATAEEKAGAVAAVAGTVAHLRRESNFSRSLNEDI